MIIKLKQSVVMNLTPEFATGVGYIKALWDADSLGLFIITSAKDGPHMRGSDHKQDEPEDVPGEAVDIQTWHHWQEDMKCHKAKLIVFARKLQRAGLRVVIHPDWLSGTPHLHVAFGKAIFERIG